MLCKALEQKAVSIRDQYGRPSLSPRVGDVMTYSRLK